MKSYRSSSTFVTVDLFFSWVIALCSKFVFLSFLAYTFTYMNESWWQASIWRVTDQVWLLSRLTYFFMSYCPLVNIAFPDFSSLCFHISKWKLVGSFHLTSYRSSSTFVTVDLLFHELLPFVQNSFSGLFITLLSHIWMKVGRKLPFVELQIKFDFRGWPTFSWVIALCLKFFFRTFLSYDFTFLNESWYQAIINVIYWKSTPKSWLLIWICWGRCGTLYCFSNTLSMLVSSI